MLDNLSTGTRDDLKLVCDFREVGAHTIKGGPEGVELVVGGILDDTLAQTVAQGVDVIVHLAVNTGVGPSVEDPRTDCYAKVNGTLEAWIFILMEWSGNPPYQVKSR